MRKIVVLAGLVLGSMMLAGTPAKAEIGCACVKFGKPYACMPTVRSCVQQRGGLCLAICHIDTSKKKVAKRKAKRRG